jgi:hypothetical protein
MQIIGTRMLLQSTPLHISSSVFLLHDTTRYCERDQRSGNVNQVDTTAAAIVWQGCEELH